MNSTLSTFVVALAAATGLSAQTTVSLTPTKDNTVYAEPPGTNSNALGYLFVGQTGTGAVRRCLMHFDVAASVPAGAVIVEASLELDVLQSTAFLPIETFVHRLTQDWGEGTSLAPGQGGGGTSATTGDVTWMHTFYPSSTWTNPGGDFLPSNWSFPLVSLGAMETEPYAGLAADVQAMLDDPANNFGWIFKTAEQLPQNARRIASRTHSNPPTLNITYLLPGESTRVGVGCPVGAGTSELDFVGVANGGAVVTIQRTNSVTSSIGADFFSLGIDPVGVTLQPDCNVYLPLAQELLAGGAYLTGATGSSSAPFAVPAGYTGFLVACQSAVLDSSPFGLSLSNAAVLIID